jgi:hypothetical protein
MRHAPALLLCALALAAPAIGQSQPPRPPAALDSIAPAQRPLVRQRAMHFYRMPDGTYWDGWAYQECRKQLDYTLKPFDRVDPGRGTPGQLFVEDKVVGTVWKINPTREARAWGLIGYLAGENGEIPEGRFEAADRQAWRDAPPLWWCATQPDYGWSFAYIDETSPDLYTHISEPRRAINKDRVKGEFFLWPAFADDQGGVTRQNWQLLPADQLRLSPDQLADALLSGKAQIVEWRFETVKDKTIWHRTLRAIDPAPERLAATPPSERPKPPIIPEGGPDLLVLKDGRYFRGRILRNDDQSVVIRTILGQSEMDLTFKPDEVKEVQAPEKR